jgi:hypothetical protein
MAPEPRLGHAAGLLALSWLSRGLKVVVLLAAAALLADVVHFAAGLFRNSRLDEPIVLPKADRVGPVTQIQWWNSAQWDKSASSLKRSLAISATPSEITFNFELTTATEHRLAERIVSGLYEKNDVLLLCESVFAPAAVNARSLTADDFQTPVWSINGNGQLFYVRMTAVVRAETVNVVVLEIPVKAGALPGRSISDTFKLSLQKVELLNFAPFPETASESEVKLGPASLDQQSMLTFTIRGVESEQRPGVSGTNVTTTSRQVYLMRLGRIADLPFISGILFSIVKVIPLLFFLGYVSVRARTTPAGSPARSALVRNAFIVTAGLLVVHFAPHLLAALGELASSARTIVDLLGQYINGWIPLPQGPWRIAPAVIGVLVPALVFGLARFGKRKPRGWWPLVGAAVVALALFSILIFAACIYFGSEMDRITWPSARTSGYLLIAGGTLLLWLTFHLLYHQIASRGRRAPSLVATLVVSAIVALQQSGGRIREWAPAIFVAMSVVFGSLLLVALTRLVAVRLFGNAKLFTGSWKTVVLAGTVILALPSGTLLFGRNASMMPTMLLDLGFQLGQVLSLIFTAALLLVLRQNGKDGSALDGFTRFVGILGASGIFFPAITRWMYIPVRFLLGLWLLGVLVRPAQFWEELRIAYDSVVARRDLMLRRLLDLKTSEGAHAEFRKNLSKKVSSAKISLEAYDTQLAQGEAQMAELRNRTTIANRPARDFTLAFGPFPSAWENGVHGLRWALLFGLPWIGLFVRDYLHAPITTGTYPLWDFIADFLNVLVTWGGIGFFFGYFYPYIRGRNGLQKGFTVFIGIVAPALPLTTLFNSNAAAWSSDLLWFVQVFIQCMLVGLVAFDYRIVRKGGFNWPMLFDLHGLTGIGISVSSIVAAIGVAVTTLLSSQATTLASNALKLFMPVSVESKAPSSQIADPRPNPTATAVPAPN